MSERENIARFANRAMLFNRLETCRRKQMGFWLFFKECCGRCTGVGFVENILIDTTAVRLEPGSGGDGPDILLERGTRPSIWLLFTGAEGLPVEKVAHCMGHGIDVFELETGDSPDGCAVGRAHIAPGNCRDHERRRLTAIWGRLQKSEIAQIGIREDMRTDARKQREYEEWMERFEADMSALKDKEVYCARCGGDFAGLAEGSYSSAGMFVHRPGGRCGEVSLCDGCWMELMGGMTGIRSEELAEWSPMPGCPECEAVEVEEMKDFYVMPKRRVLEMPERYGVRWVHEPEKRVQQYEVAGRTVTKEQLLAVVMMLRWYAFLGKEMYPDRPLPRRMYQLLRELDEISGAVLFKNNIYDWDWEEGVGDSYVSRSESSGYDKRDRLISLKWFMETVPPFPLPVL